MPILVANLSSGKGTWGQLTRIINDNNWDKVILVTTEFGRDNFKPLKKVEYIIIDPSFFSLTKLISTLKNAFKELIGNELEVSLNFISGTGKEHMAIISALIQAGISFRLIALTGEGIKSI